MCRTITNYRALTAVEQDGMTDVFIIDDMTYEEQCEYFEKKPLMALSYIGRAHVHPEKVYHYKMPSEVYLSIISRYTYSEYNRKFKRHKEPVQDLITHWLTHTLISPDLLVQPFSFWQELYDCIDPIERTRNIGMAREHFARSLGTMKRNDWVHPEYPYNADELIVDMNNDVVAFALYYRMVPMWVGDIMGNIPMWVQAEATYRRWKL